MFGGRSRAAIAGTALASAAMAAPSAMTGAPYPHPAKIACIPAPRAASTSFRWSPRASAVSGTPPAAATAMSMWAGSGLRGPSPPVTLPISPARPTASKITCASAAGLLVHTANRQPCS